MFQENLSAPQSPIQLGQFSFRSQDKMSRGSSGCVYRGVNTQTNEDVAIKAINLKSMKSSLMKQLLENELEALTLLNSSNYVLKCHNIEKRTENIYIITELCKEGDLEKKLKEEQFSDDQLLEYLKQILQGYLAIRRLEFLHRDIKPANIFRNDNNQIKIGDFGFCVRQDKEYQQYQYNVGSLHFLAPQSLLQNGYSAKSDIWAIGITMYQLLTKKTPWKGKSQKQLMNIYSQSNIDDIFKNIECHDLILEFMKRAIVVSYDERMGVTEIESFIQRMAVVKYSPDDQQQTRKTSLTQIEQIQNEIKKKNVL